MVVIGGNGDSIFRRLMTAIGRDDLAADPGLADNALRVKRVEEIDAAITAWTSTRQVADAVGTLQEANVPVGRIYTIEDISRDPHYRARGMIQSVTTEDGLRLEVPGIVPVLSRTPGGITRAAPALGEHDEEVLGPLRRTLGKG